MSDIMKRLRAEEQRLGFMSATTQRLLGEAADEIERLRARVKVLEKHLGLMIANNLAGSFESDGLATDRAIAVLPDWEEKATGYTRLQLDAAAQIVGLHDEEAKP